MVPGLMGIAQGLGRDSTCQELSALNGTLVDDNLETTISVFAMHLNKTRYYRQMPLRPNYSVTVYFVILFLLLIMSILAFSMLHYLPVSRRSRKLSRLTLTNNAGTTANNIAYSSLNTNRTDFDRMSYTSLSSLIDEQNLRIDPVVQTIGTPVFSKTTTNELPDRRQKTTLLAVNFSVAFLVYGFLPALQSYSTLPYGNQVYHTSINLCKSSSDLPKVPLVHFQWLQYLPWCAPQLGQTLLTCEWHFTDYDNKS